MHKRSNILVENYNQVRKILRLIGLVVVSLSAIQSVRGDDLVVKQNNPQFEWVIIRIPIDTPGYNKARDGDDVEGIYQLDCWINTEPHLVLEKNTLIGDDPKSQHLKILVNLLKAYRSKDVSTVMDLYETAAREKIEEQLSTETARAEWLKFVSSIDRLEPLIFWNDRGVICGLVNSFRNDESGRSVRAELPILIGANGKLKVGKMDSMLSSNLSLFFAKASNRPIDLIANLKYFERLFGRQSK